MKNYRNSDYAANKFAEGIVYRFADEVVEVTLEDYLRENPGKTKTDFDEIKHLSDTLFLQQARLDAAQGNKSIYRQGLEESIPSTTLSPEEMVIDAPESAAWQTQRRVHAKKALYQLTAVQLRRYIQHKVNGFSVRKIAEIEGTNHKSVLESLRAAEKKIRKFIENI